MARDDFKQSVIKKLKDRVSNRCSNPDCRAPTSAPSKNNGATNIGEAAHMSAASPGGPRYIESMSQEKRASIDNAIWLCRNCAKKIDHDEERYPITTLIEWKISAEAAALQELGKRIPTHDDAISAVAAALTGQSQKVLSNAIPNVFKATESSLESIDPRFSVKASHYNGITSFELKAKEEVPIAMTVSGDVAQNFVEMHKQLVETGKDIELSSEYVAFTGSKLLESLFENPNGTLRVSSRKISAILKMWLVCKDSGIVENFDDTTVSIAVGTKSFGFSGRACLDILSISGQVPFESDNHKPKFSVSLDLEKWNGVSINSLPYFDKIHSIFSKMSDGWEIYIALEVAGKRAFTTNGFKVDHLEYFSHADNFLSYTNRSIIISKAFNINILFTSSVRFTSDEHYAIAEIADIIEGNRHYKSDSFSNATGNFIADEDFIRVITSIERPISMTFVQNHGEVISIFGQTIDVPPVTIVMENVLPKINCDVNNVKPGEVVAVEWVPQENSKCLWKYI